MKKWLFYGWLTSTLVACTLSNPNPSDRACLLTELVTYQSDNAPQEIDRQTIQYINGKLNTFRQQSTERTVFFNFSYKGGQIATIHTPGNEGVLSLFYDEDDRIESASYSINNQPQAVFSLYYNGDDNRSPLVRLVETRVALPSGSPIVSRTFQFGYGPIGNNIIDPVSQSVQVSLNDGSRTQEETTFELDFRNHSPFFDLVQPSALLLVALTNPRESLPARFLQRYDCRSIKREVSSAGGTVTLRENTTFTTQFDQNFNPARSTRQVQVSSPTSSTSTSHQYQQSYQFNCRE